MADLRILEAAAKSVSRRRFIQGVIGGGAAVSSANYLFRAATLPHASVGERLITLNVNERQRLVGVPKQEPLAWSLRYKPYLNATDRSCDRAACETFIVLI